MNFFVIKNFKKIIIIQNNKFFEWRNKYTILNKIFELLDKDEVNIGSNKNSFDLVSWTLFQMLIIEFMKDYCYLKKLQWNSIIYYV